MHRNQMKWWKLFTHFHDLRFSWEAQMLPSSSDQEYPNFSTQLPAPLHNTDCSSRYKNYFIPKNPIFEMLY